MTKTFWCKELKDITKGRPHTIHELLSAKRRKERTVEYAKKHRWVYEVNYCDDKMSNTKSRPRKDKTDKRPATLNGFTRLSSRQKYQYSGRKLRDKKRKMLEKATCIGGISRKKQLHYYHHPFTIDMIYVRQEKKDIFSMLYGTYIDYDRLIDDYMWGFRDVIFCKMMDSLSFVDEESIRDAYEEMVHAVFCDLLEYAPEFEKIRFNMYRSYYLFLYRRMLKTIFNYSKYLKEVREEHGSEIENECGYMDVHDNYLNIYLNRKFKKIILRRSRL